MKQRKKSNPPKRFVVVTSICIPPALLGRAKAKAASERRNLSNYMQCLIERDLAKDATAAAA